MNERPTQERKVLEVLTNFAPEWVNGNKVFLREMGLTQYHRAIWNLQHHKERYGYQGRIEASTFTDEHGFKCYRLTDDYPLPADTAVARNAVDLAPDHDELIPGLRFIQGPLL